jgi:hypothetical protein
VKKQVDRKVEGVEGVRSYIERVKMQKNFCGKGTQKSYRRFYDIRKGITK